MIEIVIVLGLILIGVILYFVLNAIGMARFKKGRRISTKPMCALLYVIVFVVSICVFPKVIMNNAVFSDLDSYMFWCYNKSGESIENILETDDRYVIYANGDLYLAKVDGGVQHRSLKTLNMFGTEYDEVSGKFLYNEVKKEDKILIEYYYADSLSGYKSMTVNSVSADLLRKIELSDSLWYKCLVVVVDKAESYTVNVDGVELVITI